MRRMGMRFHHYAQYVTSQSTAECAITKSGAGLMEYLPVYVRVPSSSFFEKQLLIIRAFSSSKAAPLVMVLGLEFESDCGPGPRFGGGPCGGPRGRSLPFIFAILDLRAQWRIV